MDPLLVGRRWAELAGPIHDLPPGAERDVAVAELALAEVVTARWHGGPSRPARPRLSCGPGARPDCLAWSHLALAEHDAPECGHLTRRLAARHAIDVVSASPHARFGSAYLSHLLGTSCAGPAPLPIVAWPAPFEVGTPVDCYDLTHALFWLTDFGEYGWPAGASVLAAAGARIDDLICAARLIASVEVDLDLALEVALVDVLTRRRVHPATSRLLRHPRVEALTRPPRRDGCSAPAAVRAETHPRIVLGLLHGAIGRFVP